VVGKDAVIAQQLRMNGFPCRDWNKRQDRNCGIPRIARALF